MSQLRDSLRMIKFEHSVFALPFALAGAWLAAGGVPPGSDLLGIVVAAIAARSAAMAFNRVIDRRFDATNPRTASRELVTGRLSVRYAMSFTVTAAVVFVVASFWLAPLCGWLSLPVLGVLLSYSLLKRFTLWCHFGLGVALACAPGGAWLAVQKSFDPGWEIPLWIGAGVVSWVAGFDILYAIQDIAHDRRESLRSVPARWGSQWARRGAVVLHVLAVALFLHAGRSAGLGGVYQGTIVVICGLLALQHFLVRGDRIERISLVFFRVNAWVGVVYFLGLWLDLHRASSGARLGA